jgi:uncharacterized protein
MFVSDRGWEVLDKMNDEEVESLKQAVTENVREIHAFWLARREKTMPARSPAHAESRPGRNDPCPCGSGKKYKKCCLH